MPRCGAGRSRDYCLFQVTAVSGAPVTKSVWSWKLKPSRAVAPVTREGSESRKETGRRKFALLCRLHVLWEELHRSAWSRGCSQLSVLAICSRHRIQPVPWPGFPRAPVSLAEQLSGLGFREMCCWFTCEKFWGLPERSSTKGTEKFSD